MNLHDSPPILRFGLPPSRAKKAVILLHGRGSSAKMIAGLAEYLPKGDLAFIAPEAAGQSWYPQRFIAPLAANEPWLTQALDGVSTLLAELEREGLDASKVALIGFSQGACLGLEYAYRHPRRYALIGALSGGLIGPLDTPRPRVDLQGTPTLIACAESDGHIPLAHVKHSSKVLTECGAAVTEQIFPGSGHTIYPEEIDWLTEHLRA